jgi:hypothetical protein
MRFTVFAPGGYTNQFATAPPRSSTNGPPYVPPAAREFGPVCWRAVCFLQDTTTDARVGAFMGYDEHLRIADATADACKRHAPQGTTCAPPELVMLPNEGARTTECKGHIFFVLNDPPSVRRVL